MKKFLAVNFIVLVLVTQQPALAQSEQTARTAMKRVAPKIYFKKSGREVPASRVYVRKVELVDPTDKTKPIDFTVENIDALSGLWIDKQEFNKGTKTMQITVKNFGKTESKLAELTVVLYESVIETQKKPTYHNGVLIPAGKQVVVTRAIQTIRASIEVLKPNGEASYTFLFDKFNPNNLFDKLAVATGTKPEDQISPFKCFISTDAVVIH